MKKFTLLIFLLTTSTLLSQVAIDKNFDSGTPAGWTDSYTNTTTGACDGSSERVNIWSSTPTGDLTTSNQVAVSNGTDITFSIDYKVVEYSPITTPAPDGWGTADLEYSTDDGSNWITAGTIDDSNDSNSNVCETFSVTILGAAVPASSDLKFRVSNTRVGGDYYFYIDNFSATQVTVLPPNCDSTLTSATTDFSISGDVTWSAATGLATGYKITMGSSMGGTDIANNVDLSNTTSYTPAGLAYSTPYYITITPYNANGDATGCIEQSFTTIAAPPAGSVCEDPILVGTLPYTALAETTAGFFDDYDGSPGSTGCGTTSGYLLGDDIVYAYTSDEDGNIDIDLTNITDTYTGVFIYNNCADIGTVCATAGAFSSDTSDRGISSFPTLNGETYYIVVSTWASPQTTTYDLSIAKSASCLEVTGLSIDSFTDSSVTFSWTESPSAEAAWEVLVQAVGAGDPSTINGTGTNVLTTPTFTKNSLTEQLGYEVWVRAECTNNTDLGEWVGPELFTTSCSAITPNYIANFTTNVPDSCWDEAADGEVATGPTGLGGSLWGTGSYGVGNSNKVNLYTSSRREWLLSPTFDLTGGPFQLEVNVAVTQYNNGFEADNDGMGADDEVQLLRSTDGGTTWDNITTWNNTNEPVFTGTEYIADLTAYSGNIQFAIWASDGSATGSDYDFHVGKFRVRTIPLCPDISGVTIDSFDGVSVDVSWTEDGSESEWEVAVIPAGDPEPTTGTSTTTNPYTFSGLTGFTDYDVYVRSLCGVNPGEWSGPVPFTTLATVIPDCPANVLATPDAVCGTYDTTITWDASVSATNYYIKVGTTSGGSDVVPFSNIGDVTLYTVTAQTPNTTYFYTITPENAIGQNATCTEGTYSTFATGCICISEPTSNSGLGISNTKVGLTNYASGDVFYIDHSGGTPDPLGQGVLANVQLTIETTTVQNVAIWIDLDDNLILDDNEGELVFSGPSAGGTTGEVFDASFTMPGDPAFLGIHKMRIVTDTDLANSLDPCNSTTLGVTLDFDIEIIFVACTPATVTSTTVVEDCANGEYSVEVVVSNTGTSFAFVWGAESPTLIVGTNIAGPFNTGESSGEISLFDFDGACSTVIGTFNYDDCPPPAPIGVTCTSGGSTTVFTEDFETIADWTGDVTTSNTGGAWEFGTGGAGSADTGPDVAHSGSDTSYMNFEASSGVGITASAVSPAIDLTTAIDGAELAFFMHAYGAEIGDLVVGVSTSPTGPFTPEFTWSGDWQTTELEAWVPVGVNLDSYMGSIIYIEFSHTGIAGFLGDMSIDLMTVTACGSFCIDPTATVASNIATTTADIAWTANGTETSWEVAVVPAGDPEPTFGATTTNPYSASSLTENTAYDVYVRADCGASTFSDWSTVYTFTTACATISSFPWTEDFESITTPALPSCWSELNENADGDFFVTENGFGVGDSNAANLYTDFNGAGGNDDYLILPQFTLTGNERLKFSVRDRADEPNEYRVVLSSTGTAAVDFSTELRALDQVGNDTPTEIAPIDLSAYTGNVYIAIHVPSTTTVDGWDIYFDNFVVEAIPACLDVSAITIDSFDTDTATFSWAPGDTEISWEVEVQAFGGGLPAVTPGTGTITANNILHTEIGLMSNTAYEVYVRSDCGGGDLGAWIIGGSFTTACDAISDFSENFDSATTPNLPDCWSGIVEGASSFAYVETSTSADNTAPNGVSLYNSDSGSLANIMLVSPNLTNLGDGTHRLRFSARNSTASQDIEVGTLSDPTDGSTFTLLSAVDLSTTHTAYEVSFAGYSGSDTYIAIKRLSTSTYTYVYLDDMIWEAIPSCEAVSNIVVSNLTSTSADIDWTAGGTETDWEIAVLAAPSTAPGAADNTGTDITTNPYTDLGLAELTLYDVYVRADCAGDGSDLSLWSSPVSFTTPATPPNGPVGVTCTVATSSIIFTEEFDDYLATGWTGNLSTTSSNGLWVFPETGGTTSGNTGPSAASSGSNYMYYESSGTATTASAVSPAIDLTPAAFGDAIELAFYMHAYGAGMGTLNVGVSNSAAGPFANEFTWTGELQLDETDAWVPVGVDLSAYQGQTIYIEFSHTGLGTATGDMSIDLMTVEACGAYCIDPSAIVASNVTGTTADIAWTANGPESSWEIVVQEDGGAFPATAPGTGEVTTNPYSKTGLSATTAYEVYVRADCGSSTYSDWFGPYDFTTTELCPEMTGFNFDSVTDDSVTVSWTAGGSETAWEIVVQADGGVAPTGAGTATTNNPHTESGLTEQFDYEVWVRADCTFASNGYSNWVNAGSFTTPCAPLVPEYLADMTTNVPDACWDEAADGEVATGPTGLGGSLWRGGRSYFGIPSNAINLYASSKREWLLSPTFNLTGGPFQLELNVAITAWTTSGNSTSSATMGSDDEVQLLRSIDGGTTWVNITTWNAANEPDASGTEYIADLTAYSGDVQFAIWGSEGTADDSEDYDFHVGKFRVRTIPLCGDVSVVSIDSFDGETVDVSWDPAGGELAWEVKVQADGTGIPASAGTATTNNPHTEIGLTPETAYEVWVRADCGGPLGTWIPGGSFTTTVICPAVTDLTVDSTTTTSADISWIAGSSEAAWEIVVQLDGGAAPTGAGTATTNNPHTESGLTSNTAYEVYVRANCGANGFSDWSTAYSFTTACDTITAFPWTEDFESITTPDLADCWSELNENADFDFFKTWTTYGVGGSNAAGLYTDFNGGDNDDYLILPHMTLTGNERLKFSVRNRSSSEDDNYRVVLSTTGTAAADFSTELQAVIIPTNVHVEVELDLSAYTGDVYIAMHVPAAGSDGYYIYFDNFTVEEIPGCEPVSNIVVSNVTTTSADIGWDLGDIETAWEIAILAAGDPAPTGAGTATTTNPHTDSGLTANTAYEVYVRSDCGVPGFGNWVGPVAFSTLLPPVTAFPYTEDFESGPGGWIASSSSWELGVPANAIINSADSGANAWVTNLDGNYSDSDNSEVTSPTFDMSSLTAPIIEFSIWYEAENSYDGMVLQSSIDDGATWQNVGSDSDGINWYNDTSITGGPGGQQIGWTGRNGGGSNGWLFARNDLTGLGGQSNVSLRVAFGSDFSGTDEGAAFDSVTISEFAPLAYTYDGGTWSPSDPNGTATAADDIMIISGDAVINANTTCNTMTVNPGASLTVDSSMTLTATNGLTLESSSTSYSSLIRNGSIVGTMNYERHVNENGSGTTGSNDLVSAPLHGQAFSDFALANPNILNNGTQYLFGPFEKVTGSYLNWASTETATLEPGVGYRSGTTIPGGSTVTFTGTDSNTNEFHDIQYSGPKPQWNLVGNPYPSYMKVRDFLNHFVDAGVKNLTLLNESTAAIYGYDGSAINGWTIQNLANTVPSTVMAPGQGFFVSADPALTGSYDLTFTSAMRSTGSGDDYIVGRNPQLSYVALKASTANDVFGTEIYFNTEASLGFDLGYDAAIWGDTTPDFAIYSNLVEDNTGKAMALQAVNSTNLSDVVIPLGVNANQGEQLTFSIDESTLPASVNVYLEDVVANTVTLLNNSDYIITPTTDLSGTGRFFLRTSEDALSTIENSLDKLDIFTLKASHELVINGQLIDNTMLNLYDIQGRLVLRTELDNALIQNRIDVSSINSGVYIVTIQNGNQERTKKVIID
ncbi:T9SS-dependent choice-of-anchor J family protein [Psychroserpens jangbogonensis]|uniref:T9SS-dependent choice-of-anchor J family protein n=1 Tax=Psychroserpens jangbogonensis TaxID=1484460 RepID=UPI00053D5C72|nr:choice-of-anchor J domain-containing protein [Psychroserpens jangbogonensis]